jgi:hypothetical protein
MQADRWQTDLLTSTSDRMLLLCSRQAGKSTTAAALAIKTALLEPGSLTLLLAPVQRQAAELLRKVLDLFRALGRPVPVVMESALRLELATGSRIVALPGVEETIRGFSSVRLVVVDEASRVADPLYFSVRPMLAVSHGRLIALSTPFGQRGWFYEEWERGQGWERTRILATDCPRISREFLEQEERTLGIRWFQQEYMTSFEETSDAVFSALDIRNAMDDGEDGLWADDSHDEEPTYGSARR